MALCLVSFIDLFYFMEEFFVFIYGFVSKEKRRALVMRKMKEGYAGIPHFHPT